MDVIYFYIIIIFILALIVALLLRTKNPQGGLFKYNQERTEIKEKNKEKIMEMLKEKGKITNREVEESLGVSNATAIRYFDELEKEGKIIQKGQSVEVYYVVK